MTETFRFFRLLKNLLNRFQFKSNRFNSADNRILFRLLFGKQLRIILIVLLAGLSSVNAQVTVTGGTTAAGNYTTLSDAATAINLTALSAPVVVTVTADYTETATVLLGSATLNASISSTNNIAINGDDYVITAWAGGIGSTDGIIKIQGADYVTINNLTLRENTANTTATTQMEWAIAVLKLDATDGSQNIAINNCNIALNKTNTSSIGIYANNHTVAATTALVITSLSGINSNIKINGNTISNVYSGITITGYANATYCDTGLEIGSTRANTLTNFGGGGSTTYGIYLDGQTSPKIESNSITSATGTTFNIFGIYHGSNGYNNITIRSNTVSLSSSSTNYPITGIHTEGGFTNGTVNILSNIVQNCAWTAATTGSFYGIREGSVNAATCNILGNTVSGTTYSAIDKSGSGNLYYIYKTGAANTTNASNNSVYNNASYGTTGNSIYCMSLGFATNQNVNNNQVYNNTISGSGAIGNMWMISLAGANVVANENSIYNNKITKTTTSSARNVFGIYNVSSGSLIETYNNNSIHDLALAGPGNVYGIYSTASTSVKIISNNTIYSLYGAGSSVNTTAGIYAAGAATTINSNKIYDIKSTSPAATVSGLVLTGGSSYTVYNNLIGDIKATAANGASPLGANGIYISSNTANSLLKLYNNTIYLDSTSTGANFSSAGIYHIYSASATTAALDLRNNIIVNNSTPTGTGVAAAFVRSSSTNLNNYANTSNNNLFFTGTPSATKPIYYDKTTAYVNLTDYKTWVGTRESNSITGSPVFISTIGSSTNYLHIDPTFLSANGAGNYIADVLTDYDGEVRNETLPDIGADEYNTAQSNDKLSALTLSIDTISPALSLSSINYTANVSNTTSSITVTPTAADADASIEIEVNSGGYSSIASGAASVALSLAVGSNTIHVKVTAEDGITFTIYNIVVTREPVLVSGGTTAAGYYPSLSAAATALNATALTGPVTITVAGPYTETATALLGSTTLNASTSSTNTITINGGDYMVTAMPGGSSIVNDGIIKIQGTDYIFLNNLKLQDNPLNTDATKQMEWGIALLKLDATDGTQNVAINTSEISLNRSNKGTVGIYSGNHTPTSGALVITNLSGTNSNISMDGNTISNAYIPISINGYADATYSDTGLKIGSTTGNTLTNYGGGNTPTYGIYANGQSSPKIEHNTITSASGSTGTVYGIYHGVGYNNLDIDSNTVSVSSSATTQALVAIYNAGIFTGGVVNINNNIVQNCSYTTATSGTFSGIFDDGAAATTENINGNTVTGTSYGSVSVSATGTNYYINKSGGVATTINVNNNSLHDNASTGTSGNALAGIYLQAGTTQNILGNDIYNNSILSTGTGSTGEIIGIRALGTNVIVNLNRIYNIGVAKTSVNGGSVYGIVANLNSTTESFNSNTIHDLYLEGAGNISAFYLVAGNGTRVVSKNTIYNLTGAATNVSGIYTTSATNTIFQNKIYNLTSTLATAVVAGINLGAGASHTVYNNLIGDIKAPAATGASPTGPNGIYISSATTNQPIKIYNNTIHINATSTGTNFSSSGIYHTYNATATTAALDLRNNIIVNTSTPTGTGVAAALWRSASTDLNNYTTSSNNNLFYTGTPSALKPLFYEGSTAYQTLADFQTRVGARESNSISVSPSFLSTTGSSNAFLHIDSAVTSAIEGGAIAVTEVTTDFDGN